MLIIIEGPDLAGKTTLAQHLSEAHGSERTIVLNYGPPEVPDPFIEYETEFLARLPADPEILVICDRLAAGETVYGPVLRGSSRLTRGGLLHCEMLYEAVGAVRIMMMPSLALLHARFRARGDDLIDETELAGIREAYLHLAPRFHYMQLASWDSISPARLLDLAADKAARAAEVAAVPGYIGSLRPAVVMAGDVRSGDPENDPFMRAFTPAGYGAAMFLTDALAQYSRPVLRGMGILNTLEAGMDLVKADEILGHPRWVALGIQAMMRLQGYGIACTRVQHPSYVRRFRRQTEAEYGSTLMQAAGITDGK